MAFSQPQVPHGLALASSKLDEMTPALAPTMQVVSDSSTFRNLLLTRRPQLVVVFAPPASADDIAAVAAERRRRRDMRAVLVDEPADTAQRLSALRSGFDEAFNNTIVPAELAGRLALLAEHSAREAPGRRIAMGSDVLLDLDARELRISGQPVHLRPREFALLEVLASNPGRTFTRQQLLAAVGARTSIRDLRTIDVHIRWLRSKLDAHPTVRARLMTVRGAGYRLDRGIPARTAAVNNTLTTRERAVDAGNED